MAEPPHELDVVAARPAAEPAPVPVDSPFAVQFRYVGHRQGVDVHPFRAQQAVEFGIVFADLDLPGLALARHRIVLLGPADLDPDVYHRQPEQPRHQECQHRPLGGSAGLRKAVPQSRGDWFQRLVRLPGRLGAV